MTVTGGKRQLQNGWHSRWRDQATCPFMAEAEASKWFLWRWGSTAPFAIIKNLLQQGDGGKKPIWFFTLENRWCFPSVFKKGDSLYPVWPQGDISKSSVVRKHVSFAKPSQGQMTVTVLKLFGLFPYSIWDPFDCIPNTWEMRGCRKQNAEYVGTPAPC